jgi:transposase
MFYVGLDVHAKRSSMCILDANGKLVKHLEVKGSWQKLFETIDQQVPKPFAICYEASCGYGYLYDQFSKRAQRIKVAHPGQLRLIFRSKKKNDRVDGDKLAKLLYLDEVPAVHVPGLDVRAWRGLIGYRRKLVGRRSAVKTQIRAHLRGLGLVAGVKGGRGLWTSKGIKWLKDQEMSSMDGLRRDIMLDDLEDLEKKVHKVEKELNRIGRHHAGVILLRTIPGVGPRTAEAFVAHVDDVRRFSRVGQVGSYFGLVPCQDSSADRNRLGHITKEGPAPVRWLLAEAAWQGRRRSRRIAGFFDRVMRNDPERKKIALVATAHYLSRVMAAMLRSGEVWRGETTVISPTSQLQTTPCNAQPSDAAKELKEIKTTKKTRSTRKKKSEKG